MCKRLPKYKRLGWLTNEIINSSVSRISPVCVPMLALVNVKLLDNLCLSFCRYSLARMELPIAMLTQSQSYRRKPDDSKFAMGHCLKCVTDRQNHFSSMSDNGTLRT